MIKIIGTKSSVGLLSLKMSLFNMEKLYQYHDCDQNQTMSIQNQPIMGSQTGPDNLALGHCHVLCSHAMISVSARHLWLSDAANINCYIGVS